MEFLNPQFLSQYAKLDNIQVIQFLMLILIGGLAWINLRQQGLFRQSADNNSKTTSSLLTNMQTQQNQSNDRESKLATAIEHQAKESSKIGRALLLIHREQKRQGQSIDDTQNLLNAQHQAAMSRIESVATQLTSEINGIKTQISRIDELPVKQDEMLRRLDRVLGYVESMRPKHRTGETTKLSTGEVLKVIQAGDVRSEKVTGFIVEASDDKTS